MEFLQAIIMGIIQGLTEFLPVSSSGHLAIAHALFPSFSEDVQVAFDVLLHLGTLIAVVIAFRQTIYNLILAFFSLIKDIFTKKFSYKKASGYQRMVVLVIVATLPLFVIAALGLDELLENLPLWTVGICLLITSALLFISDKIVKGHKTKDNATIWDSITVGIFQMFATLPGLSRSGSTISAGLIRGFDRKFAIEFSFVLSIPAILGAAVLKIPDLFESGAGTPWFAYLCGMAAAAISGYFAIALVKKLINNNKFGAFSYYCLAASLVAFVVWFVK